MFILFFCIITFQTFIVKKIFHSFFSLLFAMKTKWPQSCDPQIGFWWKLDFDTLWTQRKNRTFHQWNVNETKNNTIRLWTQWTDQSIKPIDTSNQSINQSINLMSAEGGQARVGSEGVQPVGGSVGRPVWGTVWGGRLKRWSNRKFTTHALISLCWENNLIITS